MRAYQHMVFSTAARLCGSDAQAQDIAQEVFLKAHAHFGQLRTSPTVGGWLKTVATRLSLNYLARHRRRWHFFADFQRDDDDSAEVEFAAPDTLLGDLNSGQRQALIEQALQQLPDRQRVPLVLYHFEDMSYDDIARQLHVSLAKVKIDLFRGRAALATALLRHGLGPND